jgi:hypothetical protein
VNKLHCGWYFSEDGADAKAAAEAVFSPTLGVGFGCFGGSQRRLASFLAALIKIEVSLAGMRKVDCDAPFFCHDNTLPLLDLGVLFIVAGRRRLPLLALGLDRKKTGPFFLLFELQLPAPQILTVGMRLGYIARTRWYCAHRYAIYARISEPPNGGRSKGSGGEWKVDGMAVEEEFGVMS